MLAFLLSAGGCGNARMILVEPGGGIVAMPSNYGPNREKAIELITGRCPGGYDIALEEEVPVGSRVTGEKTTTREFGDEIRTTEEYRVRTRYEWRIHYRCR